ncbi:MFS transporter [Sciscionella marina]|uniref:MFS transporter n=1 Tax=Sciscionella marina TaxID=508770 RepID=UPI0003A786F5|nr:MFS transporter [Sciscionella marina]
MANDDLTSPADSPPGGSVAGVERKSLQGNETHAAVRSTRSVFLVAAGATTLEYYDFMLYGIVASLVFGRVFFPVSSPLTATLLALASFGVGFAARPLGGVVAGYWGDRRGRRPVLIASLLIMGCATALVGILPGYERLGWGAPVLLVVLRLIQGLATGGESGGAVVYGVESAPGHRRGVYGSFSGMGQSLGALLAMVIFGVISASLSEDDLCSWGWRVPFLIGGVLTVISVVPLLRSPDTWDFVRDVAQNSGAKRKGPLLALFRHHPRSLLLATGLSVGTNGTIYILLTFSVIYATKNSWSESEAVYGQIVLTAAVTACILFAGILTDRFGAYRLLLAASVLTGIFNFVLYAAISSGSAVAFFGAFAVAGLINAFVTGCTPVYFASLFPASARYSGVSVSYQAGAAISGFAPAVAVFLFDISGEAMWAAPLFGAVLVAVLAVCTVMLRDSARSLDNTEAMRTVERN